MRKILFFFTLTDRTINFMNLASFIIFHVVSYLTWTNKFNNTNLVKISKLYHNTFSVASWGMYIMSFIYSYFVMFIIYSFFQKIKNSKKYVDVVNINFTYITLSIVVSIILYLYKFILCALLFNVLALAIIISLYFDLLAIQKQYASAASIANYFIVELPFYMLTSWLLGLCIWFLFAIQTKFIGHSPSDVWSIIAIIIFTLMTIYPMYSEKEPVVGYMLVWALWGISCEQKKHQSIKTTCLVCGILAFIIALVVTGINLVKIYKDYQEQSQETKNIIIHQ